MRTNAFLFIILQCLLINLAFGAQQNQQVQVADPYLELRTGPGRSYPVFYVVERGKWVDILKRRTDWFKVRSDTGKEGWVRRNEMELTLTSWGEKTDFNEAALSDFSKRRWEMGVMGGDFEGTNVISLYGGYAFNANLSGELSLSQLLGDFSDSLMVNISLLAQPFPMWRISPFFALGTGIIDTSSRKTLVQSQDSTDQLSHVGAGVRVYLTRRFILRGEYRNYVIFTSKNDNKEINEWKAGFAFFF